MKPLLAIIENIFEKSSETMLETIDEDIIYSSILLTLEGHGIKEQEIKGMDKLLKVQKSSTYYLLACDELNEFWKDYKTLIKIYEYIITKKGNKREKYGIYYTPDWIVKFMVDDLVEKYLCNYNKLEDIKILEPACGCGIFLIYLFDALYELYTSRTNYSSVHICKNIIQNNIYGVDVDSKAIEICKYLMMIKIFEKTGRLCDLKYNFYNIDFLTNSILDSIPFDFIIGNPPYLENRGLNKYYDKEYLKKIFHTATGRFDIYGLFIEKSILLLKDKGYIYYIVPGNLLSNNNFSFIRKFILDNTRITNILNLGEEIFEDVGMNMIIISMSKDMDKENNLISCKNISSSEDKKRDIRLKEYKKIPQVFYENTLLNVFDIDSSYETFKLREKIYNECNLSIKDVAEVVAGIATGNIRKKLLTTDGSNLHAKKILEGKNVHRFYHKWSGLYFIDDKSIIDKDKGEYATFMRDDMINCEKLIIRQTADKFICSYDNERYYILNTLYSLKIREEYKELLDIKYLLGLLNSKLIHFLYGTLIREKGKLFPQLKVFHIKYSPIYIPHKSVQQEVKSIVDEIIYLNQLINDKDIGDKHKYVKKGELLYRLLDELIFHIFGLNSKEIKIIDKEIN